MKRIQLVLALALGTVVMQACTEAESSKAIPTANAPIPVLVMPLQKEEVNQTVNTSGQFTTDDEATLSFKTGGVVGKVLVKEGDHIRKGQLLAVLDLTEMQAQVKQAELGLEKARRDFTRAENLYKDSVATLEQYQNARTALDLAEQQLKTVRFNRTFSEIRATADGYVLKKFVQPGQVVSSGSAVIRTNGAGKSDWVFKAGVSDKEWAVIQTGDEAAVYTDAEPDKTIQAHVIRKSEGADPVSGAFMVELAVKAPEKHRLATGLFGKATITPARKTAVWNIPHEALLDGNASQGFVFVTSDNKTAQKVPVTIAAIDQDFVRVSGGLEQVAALITKGSAYLTDKSAITITK